MAVCAGTAQAAGPPIPAPADAGRTNQRLNQPTITVPEVAPSIESPVPQLQVNAPDGADKVHFVLEEVRLTGVTAYTQAQLSEYYADKIGKEVSLADVYAVAAAISQRYSRDGYVLSRAMVPPQDIVAGKVTIAVTEGYIGEVETQGPYTQTRLTREIIDRITGMRPLNTLGLEHEMLLLSDLTGNNVQAAMEQVKGPNPQPGAVAMRLVFGETHPSFSASTDNYGTRYMGPWEYTATGGLHSVFNPYDQLSVTGMNSMPNSEMHYGSVQYALPLTSDGLLLTLSGGINKSRPGYTLALFDLKDRSENASIEFSYPLIRSRAENLNISSILTLKNIHSEILESLLYEDRVRSLRAGATYNVLDKLAGNDLLDVGITQGLDILGARTTGSENLSRVDGHSDYTKISFNASRQQPIGSWLQIYTAATGQYASAPLLTSEEFGYGGEAFGRAYDSSEITGDDGIAGSIEFRYTDLPSPGLPRLGALTTQPFVFYDIGKVWTRADSGPGSTASAASAGLGVRFTLGERISSVLTAAKPLTHDVNEFTFDHRRDTRFFFSLTYQY